MRKFLARTGLAALVTLAACDYAPNYEVGEIIKESGSVTTSKELLPRDQRDYHLLIKTDKDTFSVDVLETPYRSLHFLAEDLSIGDGIHFQTNRYDGGVKQIFDRHNRGTIRSDELDKIINYKK